MLATGVPTVAERSESVAAAVRTADSAAACDAPVPLKTRTRFQVPEVGFVQVTSPVSVAFRLDVVDKLTVVSPVGLVGIVNLFNSTPAPEA